MITAYAKGNDLFVEATSGQLKKNNVVIDGDRRTIYLPVKEGTDLTAFNPSFSAWRGISFAP